MSNWQKCYGKYVANDPCFPFCSLPDGSGCDYTPIINSNGDNPFGLTQQYAVTYGDDPLTGNYSTRVYTPVIDPYQSQVPPLNFDGNDSYDGEFSDFSDPFFNNQGIGFLEVNNEDGFLNMSALNNQQAYDFQIVPTFDRTDFFNDKSKTRYRWRVFD